MGNGRPFTTGNKNGKGRPSGSRNKKTVLQEALESGGAAIVKHVKSRALKSDPTAMRLCMERLLPVRNARFKLPPILTPESLKEALAAAAVAVAEGELSAQEGESVARMVESQRRNIEVGEFDVRLTALELASKENI